MNQESNHESVNESMLSEPLLPSSSSSLIDDPEEQQEPENSNNNNKNEVNDSSSSSSSSDGNSSSHSNFESVNESMLSEPLLPNSPPRNDDPEEQQDQGSDNNELNQQCLSSQNVSSSNGNESNPSSSSQNNNNEEQETNTNILETIHQTRHLLYHLPHFKKIFGAFTLILATLVATEETIDEWSRHHHHHNSHSPTPPDKASTRLEQVTYCAQQISSSVGVPSLPFNGGSSPQLRAIDWFVEGGGQTTIVDTTRCDQGEFRDLYALQVLGSSLLRQEGGGSGGIWDRYPASNLRDVCRSWPRITCDDHDTVVTRLHLGNGGYRGTLPHELAVLTSMERLEAYNCPGLSGTIPSMVVSRLSNLRALYLHRTSLGGTIPNEMGSLTNLEELLLEETGVKGAVPKSVCSLREKGSLRELEMDCKGTEPWVECGCCSKCFTHKGGFVSRKEGDEVSVGGM